jgi:hypothetical protein
MSVEANLKDLPDQHPPPSARCVRDLTLLVQDNQRVLFRRVREPDGREPPFYRVQTSGMYSNNGLPKALNLPFENGPTPKRLIWDYKPLSSLTEIKLTFAGDPKRMSHLYRLNTALHLVSDQLLELIQEFDPHAVEISKAQMTGKRGSKLPLYWVVMPRRVFDSVDITKSNIQVRRPEVLEGTGRYVTHVHYPKGFVFSEMPSDVGCFMEEFKGGWYWHKRLILKAAESDLRGMLFGYEQVNEISDEIRLNGPDDPLSWPWPNNV